jgi:flagella basal body P-ring formation protein FlgA
MIRKLYCLIAVIAVIASPALAGELKIVTPTRDIARGEVISAGDVTLGAAPNRALPGNIITNPDAVTGMEARRTLRSGEMISASDVRRPVVVNKGQTVTMTFDAPGVSLTAMGRAMGEGGVGDTVVVQNPASYRMINAVITGTGTVRATGPATANTITARK